MTPDEIARLPKPPPMVFEVPRRAPKRSANSTSNGLAPDEQIKQVSKCFNCKPLELYLYSSWVFGNAKVSLSIFS